MAAVMFSLESHLHELVVEYSRETDLTLDDDLDDEEKEELLETFKEAETIENKKRDKREQEELINEYIQCARALVTNPFFLSESSEEEEPAELALIIESIPTYNEIHTTENPPPVKIQLALRLPTRSKPVFVPVREFLTAIRDREPLRIGNKSHLFGLNSFKGENGEMLEMLLSMTYYPDYDAEDKAERIGLLELEDFGRLLHTLFEAEKKRLSGRRSVDCALPLVFVGNFEEPLLYSVPQARVQFELEYFMAPAPKILLNPSIIASGGEKLTLHECTLIPSSHPGIIHNNTYHAFGSEITHRHVKKLAEIGHIIIPEPLFGTFVENTFPEILRYARVSNLEILEKFATLPHVADLKGVCEIHFVEGELEATLWFDYGNIRVPAVSGKTTIEMLQAFQLPEGILARLLVEEQKITDGIFGDFTCDDRKGVFHLKSDKKIVEFMTEVVPRYQDRIEFICPKSLMESFVYDSTSFSIHLNESDHIHSFRLDFKVNGELNGVSLDLLWDCLAAKRSYIELETKRSNGRRRISHFHKILVI
ncbi:MAG: SNF2 helicase associated domain-containing protein, partial [Chlamydiia bacterium]|nr:SNF2 helicase associated domain-containing protein [Chlamydiia bacterium]